ncbi:NUDIX domain-containing protein [Clavibacter sp. Sh2036]|uniref:NUDIX domain-containing protein n=1 Tax=unclassified Clavibacter TaxID=2626594 RepID=UPI0039E1846F
MTDAVTGSADAELHDDPAAFPITSSERVFAGMVWDVRRETFRYGDAEITREFVDHTGAVAVLAIDDEDRVLLIKQYRHPVRMREWEIPAGLLDVTDEPPLEAVQRELAEEADLEAAEWSVLAEFLTTPGGSDEAIRIYLARGLTATAEAFARTDEEADIEKRWVDLDEVVTAVLERRIQNPSTVIAVLQAHVARSRGWATLGPADAPWPRHPKLRDGGTAPAS